MTDLLQEWAGRARRAQEAINALGAGLPDQPGLFQLGPRRIAVARFGYRGWGWIPPGEHKEAWGLNIGTVPGRKRYALYADSAGHRVVLAYFRSEVHAQLAMTLIETLITKRLPEPVQQEETAS